MPKPRSTPRSSTPRAKRSTQQRASPSGIAAENWGTAITRIEPDSILIRGYALDELMGHGSRLARTATVLFTVSRVPGFVAHAIEEQRRQKAMRLIDLTKHHYDGPKPRRFPDAPL